MVAMKKKSLKELEEIAARANREVLKNYIVPDEIWDGMVLGIFFEDDYRIFELLVPGERPEDALVISRACVHIITEEVQVEVPGLEKRKS